MNTQGWRHDFRLGWRQLWRDLRAGELRLLMLSVALAVAALSAVAFLSDRLEAGLWRDARQLLGGDAVVVSDRPTPEALRQEAVRRGLVTNTNIVFPTMARAQTPEGASRLVALKAVEAGYPLRGRLEVRRQAQAAQDAIPAIGQVWVDEALLDALALEIGVVERSDGTGTATRPVVDAAPRGAASSAAWVGWMVIPSVRERLGMCEG